MEIFQNLCGLVTANLQEMLLVGAIMVSAIIVFIGVLKPVLFNRIACKALRKAALASADVVFSFAAVAVYFALYHFPFTYYVHTSVALTVACIVAYWLYENTSLRTLIDKLGSLALKKVSRVVSALVSDGADSVDIEKEIKKAADEIKVTAKKQLKSAKQSKKDKELENL